MNKKHTKPTTKQYIEMIANDYQFDKSSQDYLGFLNIDPTQAFEVGGDDFRDIASQIQKSPSEFEQVFNEYGLTIQSLLETELIIYEQKTKTI